MKIHPVIMAGGSGTRFWPLSRKDRPKQFLPLAGDAPLLAATVARLPPLAKVEAHLRRVRPAARGRGPADAAGSSRRTTSSSSRARGTPRRASASPRSTSPRAIRRASMAMLPADHHIARPAAFRDALAAAAQLAERGRDRDDRHPPVAAGDRLRVPEGRAAPRRARQEGQAAAPGVQGGALRREAGRETAARYLADGGYLWNSGIFVFRADVILEEIRARDAGAGRAARRRSAPRSGRPPTRGRSRASSPSARPSPSTSA